MGAKQLRALPATSSTTQRWFGPPFTYTTKRARTPSSMWGTHRSRQRHLLPAEINFETFARTEISRTLSLAVRFDRARRSNSAAQNSHSWSRIRAIGVTALRTASSDSNMHSINYYGRLAPKRMSCRCEKITFRFTACSCDPHKRPVRAQIM